MLPYYDKEKSTKAIMVLCCKLGIISASNDSFFRNSFNGGTPLTNVTGDNVDISKYLDFGFYEKVCFKDNTGLSPSEHGRWLGLSHQKGRFMCYHILIHTDKVISRSTVQRVTNIDLSTNEVKEIYLKIDVEIHQKLKAYNREYEGYKKSPQYWADVFE